jgi:hypothetical protein
MAGRNPREAIQNFVTPLQQALSCVTNAVLYYRASSRNPSDLQALTLSEEPAKLGRDRTFALTVIQHFRTVEAEGPRGPWKVQTVAYYYTLAEANPPQREIFGYHWHPQGRSSVTYPHLHLYAGAGVGEYDILNKAHFPTGRIALEEVLQLAITHFGVRPLRDDWMDIFERTQGAFEQWRTWPHSQS